MGMRGQKTEGSPCNKCGSTVRYVTTSPRNNEGSCVSCMGDSNAAWQAKRKAIKELVSKDIYQVYYLEGKNAPFNANCPYFISNPKDADKRLAWFDGYNDHHA